MIWLMLNSAATLVMIGVIWFVQLVHYPLLTIIGTDRAVEIAREHQRRTGWVVGGPMVVEGVTTLILLVDRPDGVSLLLPWVGGVFLAVALGSTVFLSVPLHEKMATNPDETVGHRLVVTNWPRTVAWTARGVLALVMLVQAT